MKSKTGSSNVTGLWVLITLLSFSLRVHCAAPPAQEYYELRIYHITQKVQEDRVDSYLRDVYMPALHRAGIAKAGVFKPIENDTTFGKLIYVFIPFKTVDQFIQLPAVLAKDQVYTEAGKGFIDAPYNDPPYGRFESILMKAFTGMPEFVTPKYSTSPSERIYELRSYESPTEAKAAKKIQMFNQGGEIKLFEKLGFNAVFFSEVLKGSHMPNLMYMTTFENIISQEQHWNNFRNHPDWKRLSAMEEYKNTTSKTTPYLLLHPTSYSDF